MRIYKLYKEQTSIGIELFNVQVADNVVIPAVTVGENGRGRHFSYIPVQLINKDVKISDYVLKNVKISSTRTGKTKFIELNKEDDNDQDVILVDLNTYGFRGSNSRYILSKVGSEIPLNEYLEKSSNIKILATGVCADGLAGRMASGLQHVFQVTPPLVLVVKYSGRMYGNPRDFYYFVSNGNVMSVTSENLDAFLDTLDIYPEFSYLFNN